MSRTTTGNKINSLVREFKVDQIRNLSSHPAMRGLVFTAGGLANGNSFNSFSGHTVKFGSKNDIYFYTAEKHRKQVTGNGSKRKVITPAHWVVRLHKFPTHMIVHGKQLSRTFKVVLKQY